MAYNPQGVTKAVLGHFRLEDSAAALVFKKVAISLRDDCPFYIKIELSHMVDGIVGDMLCCRTDRIDDRVVYADDEVTSNDIIVSDVIIIHLGLSQ